MNLAALSFFIASAICQQPATLLERGQLLEREIRAGETHWYELTLVTGDFVRGVVDQRGTSVNVKGYFPDGNKIRSFNGPALGPKTFRFVAEAPGTYRLELKTEAAASGSYRIEVQEIQAMSARLNIAREEKHRSPRLDALRREIERGNRDAVAAFWKEVETAGTPLAETIADEAEQLLVTFLWRATFETHNILVIWAPYTLEHLDDYQMARLADTDVWYKTLRMPRGARFLYQLSPNDTLSRATNAQRYATAQADPLNPRRRPDNPNLTKYEASSIAELPGASSQPWIEAKAETPKGAVVQRRIKSELLGNERSVSIYTPHGYSRDARSYPLVVLFDEWEYLNLASIPTTLDNLIAAGRIPPLLVALVSSIDEPTRTRELVCNPRFADFLHQELLPWVRRDWHVSGSAKDVTVGGVSQGGLAAVYASLRHPESFGNVICQSGALWVVPGQNLNQIRLRGGELESNWVARQFIQSPKLPVRFFLEAGLFENDIWGSGGQILERSRHLRDVLLAKGYEVHYREYPGGHDFLNWRGSIADGLIALLGKPAE